MCASSKNSHLWSWQTSASLTSLLAKSEASEVAVVREAGRFKLIGRRPHLYVGGLRLQELRQVRQSGLEGGRALLGQFADIGSVTVVSFFTAGSTRT